MMRALEEADPGATPFDEAQRRAIFERFVRDSTYGKAWLIVCDEQYVGLCGTDCFVQLRISRIRRVYR